LSGVIAPDPVLKWRGGTAKGRVGFKGMEGREREGKKDEGERKGGDGEGRDGG
jgi:hypothetical protein